MSLYKSNCSVCKVAKGNAKFRARVRHAAFKREEGDETLQDICKEFSLNLAPMYNHAKKHIRDVTEQFEQARATKLAKKTIELQVQAQKEAELALEGDVMNTIEARPAEIIALDAYIAQAKSMIDSGNLKVTVAGFLGATKIRTDWANKQASQKMDFMKAMYQLASGNKKEINSGTNGTTNPTPTTPAVDDSGENGPNTLYREAAGNHPA